MRKKMEEAKGVRLTVSTRPFLFSMVGDERRLGCQRHNVRGNNPVVDL